MKKTLSLFFSFLLVMSLVACGNKNSQGVINKTSENTTSFDEVLLEAAKAEGELVVYGSCEEEYLAAACQNFEKITGIKTTFQRMSTGEVQAKIEEEKGKPSADVWFGGTTDPYNVLANEGLLEPYNAVNAKHLINEQFKDIRMETGMAYMKEYLGLWLIQMN